MSVLAVTGTDTEVGKTVVTAALAALAARRGLRVAVVKPAQTGLAPGEPGDAEEVRRLSGVADVHEFARYPDPLAPATAARRAGVGAEPVAELARRIRALMSADRDLVLVEGAGGLLVHLDGVGGTLVDLAVALEAPVLVVARAGLGTLNHTALTCHALAAHGVACHGVVIGAWPPEPDLAARTNLAELPVYAGVRLLGRLPAGASALAPDAFAELAERALDPAILALS